MYSDPGLLRVEAYNSKLNFRPIQGLRLEDLFVSGKWFFVCSQCHEPYTQLISYLYRLHIQTHFLPIRESLSENFSDPGLLGSPPRKETAFQVTFFDCCRELKISLILFCFFFVSSGKQVFFLFFGGGGVACIVVEYF